MGGLKSWAGPVAGSQLSLGSTATSTDRRSSAVHADARNTWTIPISKNGLNIGIHDINWVKDGLIEIWKNEDLDHHKIAGINHQNQRYQPTQIVFFNKHVEKINQQCKHRYAYEAPLLGLAFSGIAHKIAMAWFSNINLDISKEERSLYRLKRLVRKITLWKIYASNRLYPTTMVM